MTPEEKNRIASWNQTLDSHVHLRLISTKDTRSNLLADFCEALPNIASNVVFVKEEGDEKELPAIEINSRLRYHAVPLGKELPPFLTALEQAAASDPTALPQSIKDELEAVTVPAFLQLFIAPQCPHCPLTVQQLIPLLAATKHVYLSVIDGTLFPEMAEAHGIRSVPTLLMDAQFRWTGNIPLKELVDIMAHRDPAGLGAPSLESMLKEGDASKVAEMMLQAGEIFPSFLDVLVHEKMFVRLGAMVVMEELAKRDPALARQAVDPLLERFGEASEPIQGDLIHVIGETGDRRSIPMLKDVLKASCGPEVKEAAKDALDRLGESDWSD